ncbi:MAG: hypothetical protein OQJ77_02285, partial [Thiovulaceae bacterium]|nr:hypothetical protein [Sulfurimonadaceae bacterium]
PSRTSYGIGLETNMFNGSILLTYDISEEFWNSSSETLSSTAYGIKWMLGHKFAIGGGINSQTFAGSTLKDIETIGIGIEWGFLGMHLLPSYTQRTVNSSTGVYIDEEALHLDLAFTF